MILTERIYFMTFKQKDIVKIYSCFLGWKSLKVTTNPSVANAHTLSSWEEEEEIEIQWQIITSLLKIQSHSTK